MNSNVTAESSCASSLWSQPRPRGGYVGAALHELVDGIVVAKRSHKRFTMTATYIDGWPLGPRDRTSG